MDIVSDIVVKRSFFGCGAVRSFLALVLVLGLIGGLTSCSKTNLTDEQYVQLAKQKLDKNKLSAAVIELKNALQKNPDNREARWLLGKAYLKINSGFAAEKELLRAKNLGMAYSAIIVPLSEAYLMLGKPEKVIELADKPPALDPPDRARLLAVTGLAYIAKKNLPKASALLENSLRLYPNTDLSYVGLSRIAYLQGDFTKARELLETGIKAVPDSGELYASLGELAMEQSRFKDANVAFGHAIELVGFNGFYHLRRAEARLHLGQLKEADSDIKRASRSVSATPQYLYTRGLYRFYSGHYSDAQSDLEKTLNALPSNYAAIYYLGACNLVQGHLEQGEQYIGRYLNQYPGSLPATVMMATIYIKTNRVTQAKLLLGKVLRVSPDNVVALRLMGQAELQSGDTDKAVAYFEKLIALQPKSPGLHTELGAQLIESGNTEAGLKQIERALELDPANLAADTIRVLTFIKNNSLKSAQEAAQHAVDLNPESPVAHNLQGLVYWKDKDASKAVSAFEKSLSLNPKDPAAAIYLGDIYATEKHYARARDLYRQVLKNRPGHLVATLKLAQLDLVTKDLDDARQVLETTLQQRPAAFDIRLMLSQLYLDMGRNADALTSLTQAPSLPAKLPPDYLRLLAQAQFNNGKYQESAKNYQALIKLVPKAPYYYSLSQCYVRLNDMSSAHTALQDAVKADSAYLPAQIALVRLLAEQDKLQNAQQRMLAMLAKYPDNQEVMAQSGWLYMRMQRPQDAVTAYQKALAIHDNTAVAGELALAYWASGKHDKALALLNKWHVKYPKDTLGLKNLANLELLAGQYPVATEHFGQLVKTSPNDLTVLNNLAWLLRDSDPGKALKYANRAVELAPSFPPVLDTRGTILLKQGHKNQALASLEEAVKYAPKDPDIRFHWIEALHAVGRTGEARQHLAKLLDESGKFRERVAAEKLYQSLR